jgi:NADPH2:quinone reductase
MRTVRFYETGGPEVLKVEDAPVPAPGPGEILIRQEAVGVNFIDTYHRSGLYPLPLPSGIGQEGAGLVESVGDGVTRFRPGDRAAYAMGRADSYADYKVIAEGRAVRLPAGVEARTAAAAMLKGMTAEFLLRRAYPLKGGQTVLIHAAAGGVGQIMTQWAKAIGATVITTAGSAEKAALAQRLGADHVILYRQEDVAETVRALTGGAGVAVAYDSVGKDTFAGSLASLARRGLLVTFGNASGPPPPFEAQQLQRAGSVFVTRPTLGDYVDTTEELDESADAVFGMIASGQIRIEIGQTFALADARAAHEALEARRTTGSTLLIPQ